MSNSNGTIIGHCCLIESYDIKKGAGKSRINFAGQSITSSWVRALHLRAELLIAQRGKLESSVAQCCGDSDL